MRKYYEILSLIDTKNERKVQKIKSINKMVFKTKVFVIIGITYRQNDCNQ